MSELVDTELRKHIETCALRELLMGLKTQASNMDFDELLDTQIAVMNNPAHA
jgi:hypothetical protein